MSVIDKVAALAVNRAPVLAFFSKRADVDEIRKLPGWAGFSGAEKRADRERMIAAFNAGEFDGLAVTYAVASTGWRAPNAKTLVFTGAANENTLAQAAHRAPQAETVLL